MELVRTQAETGLIDLCQTPSVEGPAWFSALQDQARAEFTAQGLPHRRVEEWKYTDLKSNLKTIYPKASKQAAISLDALNKALGTLRANLSAHRLVVVDGVLNSDLSDEDISSECEVLALHNDWESAGSWLDGLGSNLGKDRDAIQALNLATMQGGFALRLADKAQLDKPIHVIFVNADEKESSFATRLYFDVGAAAKLEIIESHISLNQGVSSQANIVTELKLGDWAQVSHVKFTSDTSDSVHLANVIGKLGKETDYKFFQFTLDGGITRNQIYMRYEGDEAKADISGVALLKGASHADMTLVMDHNAVGCESRELFKTVLDDIAQAVFQGKVIVQPGAQKTDGEMMSKALLLSETAEFDSKPELEIYADDVLCGHGATTGQIDDDLLFYLKARGIEDAQARALLIQAFVGEAFELVENETIREMMIDHAVAWYNQV